MTRTEQALAPHYIDESRSTRVCPIDPNGFKYVIETVCEEPTFQMQRNWNKPVGEEGSPPQTATDQQLSDPIRSLVAEGSIPERPPVSYEPSSVPLERSDPEVQRISQSAQEPALSHLSHPDEESYSVPQHTVNPAPRMIQQSSSGKSGSQNAFKRLRSMGSIAEGAEKLPSLPPPGDLGQYGYPTTTASKPEKRYPGYKAYRVTRCLCGLTTFLTILLVICAVGTAVFAFIKSKDCVVSSVTIILMDIFALVIVILEWIRLWLWREPVPLSNQRKRGKLRAEASMGPVHSGAGLPMIATTPGPMANPTYPAAGDNPNGGFLSQGFQHRLYDVPQFVSALGLVVLYLIIIILICANMAACGVQLSKKSDPEKASGGKSDTPQATKTEGKCTYLALSGIAFGALLAILVGMRVVMCCVSDACRGLCHRAASATSEAPVPMVAVNQLHQVLPGMGNYWHTSGEPKEGGYQPTTWLVNLSGGTDPRHQLSLIKPMPARYANDLTH